MASFIIKENGKILRKDMSGYSDISFSPEYFLTFDEIVEHLIDNIDEASKQTLIHTDHRELIMYHMTAGMNIRNNYGLWLESNPLTVYSDETNKNHPDQVSFEIIQQVQTVCREGQFK